MTCSVLLRTNIKHMQVSKRRAAPLKLGKAAAILSDSPAAALDVKKRLSLTAAGATPKVPAAETPPTLWYSPKEPGHQVCANVPTLHLASVLLSALNPLKLWS